MRSIICMLIIATCLFGCGRVIGKSSFIAKPQKESTTSITARIAGVYAGYDRRGDNIGVPVFLLYENRVALLYYFKVGQVSNGGKLVSGQIFSEINKIDKLYRNIKVAGGYEISGNQIKIQVFEFVNYGSYELCTYKGEINSDSLITINSCFIKSKSNTCPEKFEMTRLQMANIDSTHQWMNKAWYWAD